DIPILGHLLKYFFEDLKTTFSWRKDVGMPPGHTKAIHPIGSVALVKLLWDEAAVKEAGYTGVFKTNQ
ncbi:PLA2G4D, partial [Symbiodinium sp. CCMP2456]